MNNETIKDIAYSQKKEDEIRDTLRVAESNSRIRIAEWRNFIDYDINPLILNALRQGYEQGKSEAIKLVEKYFEDISFIPFGNNPENEIDGYIISIRDFNNIKQSLTSQNQTPHISSLVSNTGELDVARDVGSNPTGESLRAKYCDECKTKQGEEDVA